MKNWLSRLFGAAGPDAAPAADARDPAPVRPRAGAAATAKPASPHRAASAPSTAPADTPALGLDLLFWRWIAGAQPAFTATPDPGARRVLDELDRLIRSPLEAAELVPRVPEVIPQLLRSMRDDSVSAADLARQLAQDPVLVAEVIREANSPFYRSARQVRTIDGALLVLGRSGLRMLLARAAFRPIIRMGSGRHARGAAPLVWRHTELCARAASLLAPGLDADPFEAYLAGLMQDVGLIAALRLCDRISDAGGLAPDVLPQDPGFARGVLARSRALSARVALQWELPPPIAAAILQAGQADDAAAASTPLARSLARGSTLARLRLLRDHGLLEADDAAIAGLDEASSRTFERIAGEE